MSGCISGQCGIGGNDETTSSGAGSCSCGCGCGKCGCKSDSCCSTKGCELTPLAVAAHRELLKQKMKAVFENRIGRKMDKVAETVVDAVLLSLKDKMAEQTAREQLDARLMDIFKG